MYAGVKNMKSMKEVMKCPEASTSSASIDSSEAREFFGIEPGDTLLILGKPETGLIVTKPDTLTNLANQIFQTVEKED